MVKEIGGAIKTVYGEVFSTVAINGPSLEGVGYYEFYGLA